ncbi:endonuclease domain-containing 1 protein-like [Pimephales promelas]|nr:endonuclease domain-containing 1 protein-like [Pimephales promelas]
MDQNAKRICQYTGSSGPFYATLYTVPDRIPLYSAYRFDPQCATDSGSPNTWHLEPQISQPQSGTQYMVRENQNDQNNLKGNQAVSSDYSDTGYDRGHLNPNSFQCREGRTATFTLTNAAPMDACFNRIHWKSWESTLRSLLMRKLASDGLRATAYIVTGTVPDASKRIPQREISNDPERVSVPSHIWTAVCYKHNTVDSNSFSFGYIGKNQPADPSISLMSVSTLNNRLRQLYRGFSGTVQIFADDCFGDNNKLSMVQEEFKKVIGIRANQGVQMPSDVQNTLGALKRTTSTDSVSSNINVKLRKVTAELGFNSMHAYYATAEDLKIFARSACLITHVQSSLRRKREVSEGSDAVQCLLVPENQKTTADGSPCSSFSDSVYSYHCDAGDEQKPGCSSPCLYREKPKGYWCYSAQTLIPCSPRYSLITAEGERCKDDHPCGTYGQDYYWCYKVAGGWGYCSPPLWSSKAKNGKDCRSNHACAKYGSGHNWCYTDDEGNYDDCCTSDDCFSAVKDKTCRSNHMCGYHDKHYLWCYTDYENNWDYCCKDC